MEETSYSTRSLFLSFFIFISLFDTSEVKRFFLRGEREEYIPILLSYHDNTAKIFVAIQELKLMLQPILFSGR